MAEGILVRCDEEYRKTNVAAVTAGEVHQLANGRAGVRQGLRDGLAGEASTYLDEGQYRFPKTTGMEFLDGGQVFWNWATNKTSFRKVNSRDFFLGTAVGNAASGDTDHVVNVNVQPWYTIDILRDAALSVATGTAAAGGFGLPQPMGLARQLQLTATSEAQCVDMLSVDRVAVGAKGVAEFIFRIPSNGSTNAVDFNIGLANGTSTTDADLVTEHVFVHVDGGSLALNVQSKDGTTTVNAADSTVAATAGSAVANRVEGWIDFRDLTNVKVYLNGVRVLSGTTFRLDNATGPLGLLAHLEKTTGTATGIVVVDALRVRTAEQ